MSKKFKINKVIISSMTLFLILGTFVMKRNVLINREEAKRNNPTLLSIKVDGIEVKELPERGMYQANIECLNGESEWDYNAWEMTTTKLKENTKCAIEFTKNLTTEEYNKYIEAGKALRRNTYRGKDITEYYQNGSLYEMIQSGRFDDIYVGDYIIVNDVTWLVADIDHYLYSGDTALTKHHLVIIPAKPLMNAPMNATNTTEGGYVGSKMVKETLASLVASDGIIERTFGNHILEYRNYLTNKINASAVNQSGGQWIGASNNYEWFTRKIDLMSEMNVYGTNVWSSSGYDTGIDNRQYALFQLRPEFISSNESERFHYWLKNISSVNRFAYAIGHTVSDSTNATYVSGVRPRFLIG